MNEQYKPYEILAARRDPNDHARIVQEEQSSSWATIELLVKDNRKKGFPAYHVVSSQWELDGRDSYFTPISKTIDSDGIDELLGSDSFDELAVTMDRCPALVQASHEFNEGTSFYEEIENPLPSTWKERLQVGYFSRIASGGKPLKAELFLNDEFRLEWRILT